MESCRRLGDEVNNCFARHSDPSQILRSPEHIPDSTFHLFIGCRLSRFGKEKVFSAISTEILCHYRCCDYNVKYEMYGNPVPMSPDDHFQDLKRMCGGRRQSVPHQLVMPILWPFLPKSLDCAVALLSWNRRCQQY